MTTEPEFQLGPEELKGSLALNPINLGVRFLLEMAALVALGAWGASLAEGLLSVVLMLVFPLIGAGMWITFNVLGDNSRSGRALVPVPGIIRLLIEALFFGTAIYGLYVVDRPTWALIFGIVTVLHYAISYERILWMVRR